MITKDAVASGAAAAVRRGRHDDIWRVGQLRRGNLGGEDGLGAWRGSRRCLASQSESARDGSGDARASITAGHRHAEALRHLKNIRQKPSGKYYVRITGGGEKQKHVGVAGTIREAVDMYNAEAERLGVALQAYPREDASCLAAASATPPEAKTAQTTSEVSDLNPNAGPIQAAFARNDAVQAAYSGVDPEELMRVIMDMRDPGRWYPLARSMKREIHVHVGPTNSGKTYNALQRLKGAKSGIYCAPLRLLAWEVADGLNKKDGVACNMITGQEKSHVDGARHVACTVEMADVSSPFDVAVVDEAHLFGDPYRGAAFTRAIIGLAAQELHLCGDPAMVPLVEKVAAELGDNCTIHWYDRLQPLKVLPKAFDNVRNVQSGDCLVAFSRRDVHRLKTEVEVMASKRVCVIYGGLPPEARSRQAGLFNNREETGYDVLVATDAIGMGLNLSIKRVIFTTMKKFAGPAEGLRVLDPPEVKQIAGRAGRYGMGSDEGGVTAIGNDSVNLLRAALDAPVVDITKCGLQPTLDQISLYCEANPGATLVEALEAFHYNVQLSDHYFIDKMSAQIELARLVSHLPLALEDHWMFAVAPADISKPNSGEVQAEAILTFATSFVNQGRVSVRVIKPPPMRGAVTVGEMDVLEQAHAAYDLYLWFSLRCPSVFPEHELAQALRQTCAAAIDLGLQRFSSKALRSAAAKELERIKEKEALEEQYGKGHTVQRNVGLMDDRRLKEAILRVYEEEEKLEALGFGEENDEEGIFKSVEFSEAPPSKSREEREREWRERKVGGRAQSDRPKYFKDGNGRWSRDNGQGEGQVDPEKRTKMDQPQSALRARKADAERREATSSSEKGATKINAKHAKLRKAKEVVAKRVKVKDSVKKAAKKSLKKRSRADEARDLAEVADEALEKIRLREKITEKMVVKTKGAKAKKQASLMDKMKTLTGQVFAR